jgi:hypothetical protein
MCMKTMIRVAVTFFVVALAGCASERDVVRCDGRLEPINAPMPRVKPIVPDSDGKTEAARVRRE